MGKIYNKAKLCNRLTRRSAKRTFQRTRQKSLLRRLFPGQTVVCRKASLSPTAAESQCQRSHRRSGYAFRPPPNEIHIATYTAYSNDRNMKKSDYFDLFRSLMYRCAGRVFIGSSALKRSREIWKLIIINRA